jgi:hypothetical protein
VRATSSSALGARLAVALILAAAGVLAAGCGGGSGKTAPPSTATAPAPPPRAPAFGITEDNANLLWAPTASAPAEAAPFMRARRELAALHPGYIRLLVNWAALQPTADAPPQLSAPVDGCARGVQPCGPYPGLEGQLAAIASQQRAARARGEAPPEVVLDLLGTPIWAALPPHGCEAGGTPATARALRPDALGAYRRLIASLLAIARREGVALPWWAPWNEPNDPRFLSPQRASCDAAGAPLVPDAYAQLARAMSAELKSSGTGAQLLLGELGGYLSGSPHRLGVEEFVRALPDDVMCLSRDWSVHAYAAYGRRRESAAGEDPVAALERALDARGGCAAGARVWVTEAGAGAERPGRPRSGAGEQAGYAALLAQLRRWKGDDRVAAIFQYTFREDPAYPVGLIDPTLTRVYPTYGLWMALASHDALPTSAAGPAAR